MASVYSDASWTGDYTYTRVRVDYSGTSATAHLLYSRTNTYSGATYSGNATFSFGGASVGFNQTRYGQMTDSELASVSFGISTSGGTYSGSSTGGYMGGSWSVYIPPQSSAPTGLSVSIAEKYPTGAKFNVSVSSYGNPSSASGRYIEAAILNQNSYGATYKYQIASNTSSSSITVTDSSYRGGTLTIQPNKEYYYGGYANNTQLFTSSVVGQFVTLAEAPILNVAMIGETEATFVYSTSADGGKYAKILEYSLDDGLTWITYATVNTGSASSGTFTISGLTKDVTYILKNRVSTASGTTMGTDIVFRTSEPPIKNKFYGPVNDTAERAIEMYGSVGGTSQKIIKLYGSENGSSKLIHQGFGHINYT